jgi:peptidoglycan hydrolase-like protein with peptidoglycan-binding domain
VHIFTRFSPSPHGLARAASRLSGRSLLLAASLAAPMLTTTISGALAQVAAIEPGQAVVTRFSGVVDTFDPDGQPVRAIDLDGPVANMVDLRAPGAPPSGQPLLNIPQSDLVIAAEIGQVFGIALDNDGPANIYLTATSIFGLHLNPGGDNWMEGQWGLGGGPGTVYKLHADDGYSPSIFAQITLGGRENTGAALGNIVFDRSNKQFFVSDLETGMIHRIGQGGQDLGFYDHGTTGRAAFVEAISGLPASVPAIPFDPGTAARVEDCAGGEFTATPPCWNFADFRRRVWGMAVHRDNNRQVRLYYAVWGTQAFGNPEWPDDQTDQQNSVWSIGIAADGSFVASDVRREFLVPGFFANQEDYQRAGGSNPISDMAISGSGEMVLAEHGGIRNLGLDEVAPFAWPNESRVLRYQRNDVGVWLPVGRHDVGTDDRQLEGQPYMRSAAAGGVAFGYGYDGAGHVDAAQRDDFVWFTGDKLCGVAGTCPNTEPAPTIAYSGIQGQGSDHMDDLAPAAAYANYPAPGPATPPVGPAQSYFVGMNPVADLTFVGDIEVFAGGRRGVGAPDLAVTKTMPEFCVPGEFCSGHVTITNVGTAPWFGPLFVRDIAEPGGLDIASVSPPWTCGTLGPALVCYHPVVELDVGEFRTIVMDIIVPPNFRSSTIVNCAAVIWPLANSGSSKALIRSVQTTLRVLGYDVGAIDGDLGPRTKAAVAALQNDLGLAPTGVIDQDLLDILFPGGAGLPGDGNPANDRDCDESTVDRPPPTVHLPVGSTPQVHLPVGSRVHLPAGSVVHKPAGSVAHLPIGSGVHLPVGSGIHLPVGSGAHLPIGSATHFPIGSDITHLPVGSGTHLPIGSTIHFPIGSDITHLPVGSGTHLPIGSTIHFPIGSDITHLPIGSVAHFPVGSKITHLPAGSKPIHQPVGSVIEHLPLISGILHQPAGSAPVHQPVGSRITHLPAGSRPVHAPTGSGPVILHNILKSLQDSAGPLGPIRIQ